MASKEPVKVYVFFNCDEEKSEASMNVAYNNEAYKSTKASRKALWAKVREEAEAGRVQVEDEKAAKEAVLNGDPCEASKLLRYGNIVELTLL